MRSSTDYSSQEKWCYMPHSSTHLGEVGAYTPWVANEHPTTASGAQIENRNLGCCSLTEEKREDEPEGGSRSHGGERRRNPTAGARWWVPRV
ncbi:unnamed protein product [Triticum turgidum subsp. durum]|uniref:Uncharacterized protein n=1 Tax=Triticum turgidum subsp. durum TaxID=4567 RepID=A0A9R0R8Q8_TRITD|nr:unnamed protein product [Triticum turgidum subsp. durum]